MGVFTLKLTEGQAHDGRSAQDTLETLTIGQILLADRAYDSYALRQSLLDRGAWANVKPMPNRTNVPAFSAFLYRYRNLVERFFNKLKHFRAVATGRYGLTAIKRGRDYRPPHRLDHLRNAKNAPPASTG